MDTCLVAEVAELVQASLAGLLGFLRTWVPLLAGLALFLRRT
jgi:hypothetical protein